MLNITIKTNLSRGLEDPSWNRFLKIIQASAFILEDQAVKEAPVKDGDLRGDIKVVKNNNGYRVTSTATSGGRPYPIYVHEGTGKYRGGADRGFTTGRSNQAGYTQDDLILFKVLAKMGKLKGQRPNKFFKRAKDKKEDRMLDFIKDKVNKEFK